MTKNKGAGSFALLHASYQLSDADSEFSKGSIVIDPDISQFKRVSKTPAKLAFVPGKESFFRSHIVAAFTLAQAFQPFGK
jgi:hypothetical protein